jgi:hypothetical protein
MDYNSVMRAVPLFCLPIAAILCSQALAYPRPDVGTENIPKLMADSSLVCKGEVTEAPELTFSADPDPPRLTATAVVHVDRCFKGEAPANETLLVLFDSVLPPHGGPYVVLQKGDYRLFFLKPENDKYVLVDVWFGNLPISRRLADLPVGNAGSMQQLESDLKAGLRDSDSERVLDSIRMLGNMRHLQSTVELESLLGSPDPLIRTSVYEAMLRLRDYSVLPAVARWLEAQPPAPPSITLPGDALFEMQYRLGRQLSQIRDPAALPVLLRLSQLPDPILRREALDSVRAIRSAGNI